MDSHVEARIRSYLDGRFAAPAPIGMEERVFGRAMRERDRAAGRPLFWQVAGVIAVMALAFGIGLAIHFARSQVSPTVHPTIVSPTVKATPPPGGPAPAALQGQWVQPDVKGAGRLVIRRDSWVWGGARGELVVNGDEVDFYNGNYCGIRLPGGVGRYRWSISGGLLSFTLLAADPCTDRPGVLSAPFTKVADSG